MSKIEDMVELGEIYKLAAVGFKHDGCVKRLTDINTGEFVWFDGTRFVVRNYNIANIGESYTVTTPDSIVYKLIDVDNISGCDSYNYHTEIYCCVLEVSIEMLEAVDDVRNDVRDLLTFVNKLSLDMGYVECVQHPNKHINKYADSWEVSELDKMGRVYLDIRNSVLALIEDTKPITPKPTLRRVK